MGLRDVGAGEPRAHVPCPASLTRGAVNGIDCSVTIDTCSRAPVDLGPFGPNVLPYATDDMHAHYSLGREIGRGSYGVVRECFDRDTGNVLACKVIQKRHLGTVQDRLVVAREVGLMQMVRGHPSIVTLEGVYEDQDEVVLVMELCNGGELYHQILSHGRFQEAEAAAIFAQIVDAIAFCHSRGVVHRDLKPENILFNHRPIVLPGSEHSSAVETYALEVKLADFGLGVWLGPGEKARARIGSLMYEAPEVVCGAEYDAKADVWSLGIILHALLSGTLPFIDADQDRLARKICAGEFHLRFSPWPFVSDEAKSLIRRLIVLDPKKRPTAAEVLSDPWLAQFIEALPPSPPLEPLVPAAPDRAPSASSQGRVRSMSATAGQPTTPLSPYAARKCTTGTPAGTPQTGSSLASPRGVSPRGAPKEEASSATGYESFSEKDTLATEPHSARQDSFMSTAESVCSVGSRASGGSGNKGGSRRWRHRHSLCCSFLDLHIPERLGFGFLSKLFRMDFQERAPGHQDGQHSFWPDRCLLLSPIRHTPLCDEKEEELKPKARGKGEEELEGEVEVMYQSPQLQDKYFPVGSDLDCKPHKRGRRLRKFLDRGRGIMRL